MVVHQHLAPLGVLHRPTSFRISASSLASAYTALLPIISHVHAESCQAEWLKPLAPHHDISPFHRLQRRVRLSRVKFVRHPSLPGLGYTLV